MEIKRREPYDKNHVMYYKDLEEFFIPELEIRYCKGAEIPTVSSIYNDYRVQRKKMSVQHQVQIPLAVHCQSYGIQVPYCPQAREKQMKMDETVDIIRKRFGFYSVQRGLMYRDRILSACDAKSDHTVHPHGYFGQTGGIELLWKAASLKAGGAGIRYTCIVDGKESHLFYEDNNMWFMEERQFI